jgi:anti-anti-sigma factor
MSPSFAPAEDPEELQAGAPFSCTRLSAPEGVVRLKLVGELDLVTADRARGAIARVPSATRTLICDLDAVWFVDFTGLRVLLDAAEHAGRRLAVVNCPPIVRRILRVLELDDVLQIHTGPPSAATPERAPFRLVG